jgi:hypothetical protein
MNVGKSCKKGSKVQGYGFKGSAVLRFGASRITLNGKHKTHESFLLITLNGEP